MPRDIRSYFAVGVKNSTPEVKKPQAKKRAVISSDEEDTEALEIASKNKKVKANTNDTSFEETRKNKNEKSDKKNCEIKISPDEKVFGKKPVKRLAAKKVGNKEKAASKETKDSQKVKNNLNLLDDDDDFAATLQQLDTEDIGERYLKNLSLEKQKDTISSKIKNINSNETDSKKSSKTKSSDKCTSEKNGLVIEDKKSPVKQSKSKETRSPGKHSIVKQINIEKSTSKHKLIKDEKLSVKEKESDEEKESSNKTNKGSTDKANKSFKDENELIEEKIEKKKQQKVLYHNYLQRGGARNPGSKEIPQGAEFCLSGLSFLITGVLDSLERTEAEGIIKEYGGRIVTSVSKKLDYLVIGDQAGPSKLEKADSCGVKKIDEDQLLELIKTRPAGKTDSKQPASINKNVKTSTEKKKNSSKIEVDNSLSKKKLKLDNECEIKREDLKQIDSVIVRQKDNTSPKKKQNIDESLEKTSRNLKNETSCALVNSVTESLSEKYRPKDMKQIIGQNGDKSNAKKLYAWLQNWQKNRAAFKNAKKKDDSGALFRAALLSGPPGIGKTTTAHIAAKQLGYDVIEFNASDTRSKKSLQNEISGVLSNANVKSLLINTPKDRKDAKHILIMDEVDGMAGNEDRGGVQELIGFIKTTEIPIICICNDRQHPKIRTLANYTYDLRFSKPRLEQIRGAMMSICCKENIKITPDELSQIIQSTNQDIRQVINHLSLLSAFKGNKDKNEKSEKQNFKNVRLGPWDVVKKVFSCEDHKNMSIHDKSDLFFHDYNISPLFVEENYLSVVPAGPKSEVLNKIAECTDSLAVGDTIEKSIRSSMAWSLLPTQACFSSVIPGTVMSGYITSMINFPSWLGRNSKRNKFDRLLQDITVHTRLTTGASKESINLDYLNMLLNKIIKPLIENGIDGVDEAVEAMNKYNLMREDLDALIELTTWPGKKDPMQLIDTKVKAAFTRAYNKSAPKPFTASKKKNNLNSESLLEGEEDQDIDNASDNEDDDKIENDKMIKAKPAQKASKNASKKSSEDTAVKVKKPQAKRTTASKKSKS